MPEETSREIPSPDWEAVLSHSPDETGYFRKNGWYAVIVSTLTQKLFDAGDEQRWLPEGKPKQAKYVVGEKIHYTDIDESQHILRSNLRGFGEGYGVLTRCGNWQPASAYDVVVPESRATI